MEKVKAFKVFNSDWTCRGFQYNVGETYKMDEDSDHEDRMKVKDLPNSDARVFEEISGIRIEDYENIK